MKRFYPIWIFALFLIGGGVSSAAGQNFRLDLVTLSPADCGALNSIPAECLSQGQTLCDEQNGELIEMVTQFDKNTRDVTMLWFQCAVTAEVSE